MKMSEEEVKADPRIDNPFSEEFINSIFERAKEKALEEIKNADKDKNGKISIQEFLSWFWEKILEGIQVLMVWVIIFISLLGVMIVVLFPNLWNMILDGSLTPESLWMLWSSGGISTVASTVWKIWKLSKSKDKQLITATQLEAALEKKKRELKENEIIQQEDKHATELFKQAAEYEYKIILLNSDKMDKEIEAKAKDIIARIEIKKNDLMAERIELLEKEIVSLEKKEN